MEKQPPKHGIVVEPLRADQIPAVFPLVREAAPGLDLKSWTGYARRLLSPRRGEQCGVMIATRQPRRFPCGLFCWRREHDLVAGDVLIAEHFIALDLLDHQSVLSALVAELDALAARLGCGAIRSLVHGTDPLDVTPPLFAAGHRTEGALLTKPVRRLRGAAGAPRSMTG